MAAIGRNWCREPRIHSSHGQVRGRDPMTKYALHTKITSEKTLSEIQSLLSKYKAGKFGFVQDELVSMVGFEIKNRQIRFMLPMPNRENLKKDNRGYIRNKTKINNIYEQEKRSRWRALLLSIKAKLESVETGIETFEEAFLAHIVLPEGKTMGEWVIPQIEKAYQSNKMPALLTYEGNQ